MTEDETHRKIDELINDFRSIILAQKIPPKVSATAGLQLYAIIAAKEIMHCDKDHREEVIQDDINYVVSLLSETIPHYVKQFRKMAHDDVMNIIHEAEEQMGVKAPERVIKELKRKYGAET